jgi:dipeptidyl aminopeptidase/acylaminoacyl peptidase
MLPALDIEIVDESWDQASYLVKARAPLRAGEFLLADMENQSIQWIGFEYEHLSEYPLAETRLVEIESSSGGRIVAHLTLPHTMQWPPESTESAVTVPAVVIARGSPGHEDIADPHYLAQFLAANGYAVLRVNNRPGLDFGGGWLPERALVGWRQAASDLQDAVDYLIASGVSSPDRVCGAGKDFGAHTLLMAAIEFPDTFKCLISIAGVTDPGATMLRLIEGGAQFSDGESIGDISPIQRSDELDMPILMFHGASDWEVSLDVHASTLAGRLERSNEDVALIEYPQSTHAISRGPDRVDMLARIGGFLAEYVGPGLPEGEVAEEPIQWRPN